MLCVYTYKSCIRFCKLHVLLTIKTGFFPFTAMESYAALKKHVSDTHGNPFNADDTFESLFSETNSLNVSPSKGEHDTPPSAARQSFEGTLTMDNHAENQEYQSVLDVPPAEPIKCNVRKI